MLEQACARLGVTRETAEAIIDVYLDNMVAISLFHRPSLGDKLRAMDSAVELGALLAAMLGYAARFRGWPAPPPRPGSSSPTRSCAMPRCSRAAADTAPAPRRPTPTPAAALRRSPTSSSASSSRCCPTCATAGSIWPSGPAASCGSCTAT